MVVALSIFHLPNAPVIPEVAMLNLKVRQKQRNKTGTNGLFGEPFSLQSYRGYGR
jgi:hypothetical protein